MGAALEPKLLAAFWRTRHSPTPLESLERNLESEKIDFGHVGMMPPLWLGRGLAEWLAKKCAGCGKFSTLLSITPATGAVIHQILVQTKQEENRFRYCVSGRGPVPVEVLTMYPYPTASESAVVEL